MNTTLEKKKRQILFFFKTIPIVTTEQIALFFQDVKYPRKRASECLVSLQEEGVIEGRCRKGKSKCWRLSKKGRNLLESDAKPIPMTTRHLQHILAIGNVYVPLFLTGKLRFFEYEKKIDFVTKEEEIARYSPDAFFMFNERPFFLEVQRTPLPKERWELKWEIASDFFQSTYVRKKEEFHFLNELQKLPIVVITNQSPYELPLETPHLELSIFTSAQSFINQL